MNKIPMRKIDWGKGDNMDKSPMRKRDRENRDKNG